MHHFPSLQLLEGSEFGPSQDRCEETFSEHEHDAPTDFEVLQSMGSLLHYLTCTCGPPWSLCPSQLVQSTPAPRQLKTEAHGGKTWEMLTNFELWFEQVLRGTLMQEIGMFNHTWCNSQTFFFYS